MVGRSATILRGKKPQALLHTDLLGVLQGGKALSCFDDLGDVGVGVLPVVEETLVPLAGTVRVAQLLVDLPRRNWSKTKMA